MRQVLLQTMAVVSCVLCVAASALEMDTCEVLAPFKDLKCTKAPPIDDRPPSPSTVGEQSAAKSRWCKAGADVTVTATILLSRPSVRTGQPWSLDLDKSQGECDIEAIWLYPGKPPTSCVDGSTATASGKVTNDMVLLNPRDLSCVPAGQAKAPEPAITKKASSVGGQAARADSQEIVNNSGLLDLQIKACTQIIESHSQGDSRAVAFLNRGTAYRSSRV